MWGCPRAFRTVLPSTGLPRTVLPSTVLPCRTGRMALHPGGARQMGHPGRRSIEFGVLRGSAHARQSGAVGIRSGRARRYGRRGSSAAPSTHPKSTNGPPAGIRIRVPQPGQRTPGRMRRHHRTENPASGAGAGTRAGVAESGPDESGPDRRSGRMMGALRSRTPFDRRRWGS